MGVGVDDGEALVPSVYAEEVDADASMGKAGSG